MNCMSYVEAGMGKVRRDCWMFGMYNGILCRKGKSVHLSVSGNTSCIISVEKTYMRIYCYSPRNMV